MKKNILIVEDESVIAMEISSYVQNLGYNVIATVSSAKNALKQFLHAKIDVVLIDVHIKGNVDGISCAEEIKKQQKDIDIIYISALSDDETLDRAIKTDPIAYLIKPFHPRELLVALKIATKESTQVTYVGDIVLDNEFSFNTSNQELIYLGEVIHLTKKEKELLSLFVYSKNQVLDIHQIENAIWPDKIINDNTRRALIAKLRTKLNHKFLTTVHAIGYKFSY